MFQNGEPDIHKNENECSHINGIIAISVFSGILYVVASLSTVSISDPLSITTISDVHRDNVSTLDSQMHRLGNSETETPISSLHTNPGADQPNTTAPPYPYPLYVPTRNFTVPFPIPIPNPLLDPRNRTIYSRLRNITLPPKATTGWVTYRLGDMFLQRRQRMSEMGRKFHSNRFPQSLAVEYMKRIEHRDNETNGSDAYYDSMMRILRERIERNETLQKMLPDDHTLVIHLRTGDIIDRYELPIREFLSFNNATAAKRNGHWYTRGLPFYAAIWDQIQEQHIRIGTILVVTGWHVERTHFRSIAYINEVIKYLEQLVDTVEIRINQNPDEDALIMSQSTYFVESGGGYSRMIGDFVERFNGSIYGKQNDDRLSRMYLCHLTHCLPTK